jgi:DNA-directed RNA polymerase beta subunit
VRRPSPVVATARRSSLPVETDDIDHFGNRRLRSVGELIQNQVRTGLSRMERVVRERMTTQDVEAITPQTLINIRPWWPRSRSSSAPASSRSSWTRTTRCRA